LLPLAGLPEAEALALGLEDGAAVREPVECGSSEPFSAEHLGLLFEGQVRCHDQTLPLIRCAEDVKKQLGASLAGYRGGCVLSVVVNCSLPWAWLSGIASFAERSRNFRDEIATLAASQSRLSESGWYSPKTHLLIDRPR